MNIEQLQQICAKLPGVTEDIKWENDLCFSVGGKMFLVASLQQVPTSASFKVTDDQFAELSLKKGFKPAPYMARHKWIWLEDINLLTTKQWAFYVSQSYEIIKQKLPKKIQKQLSDFSDS
jgi:predicted DNA-binding protein (MmcQ/YjbR family)